MNCNRYIAEGIGTFLACPTCRWIQGPECCPLESESVESERG